MWRKLFRGSLLSPLPILLGSSKICSTTYGHRSNGLGIGPLGASEQAGAEHVLYVTLSTVSRFRHEPTFIKIVVLTPKSPGPCADPQIKQSRNDTQSSHHRTDPPTHIILLTAIKHNDEFAFYQSFPPEQARQIIDMVGNADLRWKPQPQPCSHSMKFKCLHSLHCDRVRYHSTWHTCMHIRCAICPYQFLCCVCRLQSNTRPPTNPFVESQPTIPSPSRRRIHVYIMLPIPRR